MAGKVVALPVLFDKLKNFCYNIYIKGVNKKMSKNCNFCKNIITNEEYDSMDWMNKDSLPSSFIIKDNIC